MGYIVRKITFLLSHLIKTFPGLLSKKSIVISVIDTTLVLPCLGGTKTALIVKIFWFPSLQCKNLLVNFNRTKDQFRRLKLICILRYSS